MSGGRLFFYVCDAGHKITAPWPLTECPSFLRGAVCPGALHAADSAFRKKNK